MNSPEVRDVLSSLLERFGIRSDHPAVMDCASQVCADLGHVVEVLSLRHGVCKLGCDARTAAMLNWDEDVVVERVNSAHPGAIAELIVQVRKAGRNR